MRTIFMNIEDSKTNNSQRFRYCFIEKRNLKNTNKSIALVNLSIYYTQNNTKSAYKNNTFKISHSTWNDKCDLPSRSYFISDIQICVDRIKNLVVFKIKTG